ncbi:MAG: protein kinase domain-containing protein [Polyangiaceae bacterium]
MDRLPAQGVPAAETSVPRPGDLIEGKYRVEKILGEGGMGVVLAAHHELLDQRVAVKVLTATDEKAISRFSFEARSTARLKSEHVARVMDVGALPGGAPFMVMEYLEGCDLEELLHLNGPMQVEEAVGYVLQALEGLSQAHGLGIVHRDLKPANLFLAVHPSGVNIIKIVDFGISKSIVSRRSGKTGVLTAEHSTVGSPAYMAPEQIRASKDVDPRADLWSLGVVLYELLSGEPPFPGESVGAIFAAVLEKEAPRLRNRLTAIPEGLSDAVARCMERDREKRYPDALELAKALASFGPPDAGARVTRIEQTLHTAMARVEAKELKASSVRVSVGGGGASGDLTAELTESGSHEIRFATDDAEDGRKVTAPPSTAPRRIGQPAHATAGHVAFAADTPNPDAIYRGTTIPSVVRRSRRRAGLAVVGATGVVAVIAVVAIMRTTVSAPSARSPASASAVPAPTPVTSTEPASAPKPPDPSPVAASEPATTAVASPTKAKITAAPRRGPSAVPAAAKKHYGVLDSPD